MCVLKFRIVILTCTALNNDQNWVIEKRSSGMEVVNACEYEVGCLYFVGVEKRRWYLRPDVLSRMESA